MKNLPVGAVLFHADGWTDGQTDRCDEANSCFSQFCCRASKRQHELTVDPATNSM